MNFDYPHIGITISIFVNFILLYTRRKKWFPNSVRWSFTSLLSLLGIYHFFNNTAINKDDAFLFGWCLVTPLIFNSLDRCLKLLSLKINNRDLYLWLRGSDDQYKNDLNGWDRFFSIILLFALIALPIFGN